MSFPAEEVETEYDPYTYTQDYDLHTDAVFLILYKELYYRHIYAKVSEGFFFKYERQEIVELLRNLSSTSPPPAPLRLRSSAQKPGKLHSDCSTQPPASKHWSRAHTVPGAETQTGTSSHRLPLQFQRQEFSEKKETRRSHCSLSLT
ncbi:UNVERIFIED_CONTAM: hypothetical protein FKN15_010024 [Acipenser sinensis]